jgi:hypothetical protein
MGALQYNFLNKPAAADSEVLISSPTAEESERKDVMGKFRSAKDQVKSDQVIDRRQKEGVLDWAIR